MGTWGARIYEDDHALDVRGEFLDLVIDEIPVDEAEQMILDAHLGESKDDDQRVYLALACAELETASLTENIRQKALEQIATGPDAKVWEELVGPRKREFTLIKKYIEAYDGKPVKRKSWVELQKADGDYKQLENQEAEKLDDVTWQTLDKKYDDLPEEKYFAIAGAHLDCFVFWLITRGHFNARDVVTQKDIEKVRAGKMPVIKFIDTHMDLKFFDIDVLDDVRNFVKAYYDFNAPAGNPQYIVDYTDIVGRDRKELSFTPDQKDRNAMAQVLDSRLKEYQDKPYSASGKSVKARSFTGIFFSIMGWLIIAVFCFVVAVSLLSLL